MNRKGTNPVCKLLTVSLGSRTGKQRVPILRSMYLLLGDVYGTKELAMLFTKRKQYRKAPVKRLYMTSVIKAELRLTR